MAINAQRLAQRRNELGLSQGALGKRAGVSQQTIALLESGAVRSTKFLMKIAGALDIPPGDLDDDYADVAARAVAPEPRPESVVIPAGEMASAARDLPVYAAAMGGEGHEIVTFDAIDWVRRPAPLQYVKGAYGLIVVGSSMSPRYEPGEVILINPHLPPLAGTYVVLFNGDRAEGELDSMVKRLVKVTPTDWHLQQFNPAHEFVVPRRAWPQCHRVIGSYDRK